MYLAPRIQLGARFHGTLQRTVGNIAGAFDPGEDPEYADLYLSSTMGGDVLFGYRLDALTPYLSIGWTEVQSFFWIGDNDASGATVSNNLHPYSGLAASLGVDALVKGRLRLGGEFYTAPGGYSELDGIDYSQDVDQASRYGSIYTGRVRLAYELRKKKSDD